MILKSESDRFHFHFHFHFHLHLHLQIDGEHSRSIERHFLFLLVKNWTFTKIQDEHLVCMIPNVGLLEHLEKWSPNGKKIIVPLPQPSYDLTLCLWNCIFGSNCPERIFQKIVTCLQLWQHFLHWFDCFNYFYGSITCARVGKTKILTRHLRLGTWKKPLNMDDFEVFSHFSPFCISLCMLYDRLKTL